MSYVQEKERIFNEEYLKIPRLRSEARMKKYSSAEDVRVWCDEVEDRRQHFIKNLAKNKGSICKEGILPIDVLMYGPSPDSSDADLQKLKDKINYLEALLDIYRQLKVNDDQKEKLAEKQREPDGKRKKEKNKPESTTEPQKGDRKRKPSADKTEVDKEAKKKREKSEPDLKQKEKAKAKRKPSNSESGPSAVKRSRSYPETDEEKSSKEQSAPKIARRAAGPASEKPKESAKAKDDRTKRTEAASTKKPDDNEKVPDKKENEEDGTSRRGVVKKARKMEGLGEESEPDFTTANGGTTPTSKTTEKPKDDSGPSASTNTQPNPGGCRRRIFRN